jgi:DNA-binding GntR family transcriptional regulator
MYVSYFEYDLGDPHVTNAAKLPQLQKTNLRQQARVAIQAQVITGGVEPGSIYPVAHFSSQLGVSATPVREALFDLAHDGLVELVPNRGFRVVELSDGDLDEILELRFFLEIPAIRMAVGRLSAEAIAECAAHARATEMSAAEGDLTGFLAADREFHLRLLDPVENRRLVDLIARLRDQARLPGLRSLAEAGTLTAAAEEHQQILQAVVDGDADGAEARMRSHLQHVRGIWAGRVEANNTPST